jgi:dihydropteroate synthase
VDSEQAWRVCGNLKLSLKDFVVMGVVNCTPDSFYDGGRYMCLEDAVRHGRDLIHQGARILDVGGESTRPGAQAVSLDEERRRVLPVVQALGAHAVLYALDGQRVALSVDTTKAEVAEAALQAGAVIVNDVSAGRADPAMPDVLAQYKPGYVLMHAQGTPGTMQAAPTYTDVVGEVSAFFEQRMARLTARGLPEECIVLDPGIGFGKRLEHNLALLRNIERFQKLGRPILIGLSNKSLWKDLLGLAPDQRGTVTQVATALLADRGVAVHRVHDVEKTVRTLQVVQSMKCSGGRTCSAWD